LWELIFPAVEPLYITVGVKLANPQLSTAANAAVVPEPVIAIDSFVALVAVTFPSKLSVNDWVITNPITNTIAANTKAKIAGARVWTCLFC